MTTFMYSHPACIEHDPGEYHPERPDRLRAVMAGLEDDAFKHLERHEAPIVDLAQVKLVHDAEYVDMIMDSVPSEGRVRLDPDTVMSTKSGEATQRAAGGGDCCCRCCRRKTGTERILRSAPTWASCRIFSSDGVLFV